MVVQSFRHVSPVWTGANYTQRILLLAFLMVPYSAIIMNIAVTHCGPEVSKRFGR
jgi:hypothetical protein